METHTNYDVIIVGGSYAGLSAAMALGRSLRKVLVIDSGQPCNRFTPHSHNFITHDGSAPGAIAALAKEQVMVYPTVSWLNAKAVDATKTLQGFTITVDSGESYAATKLLFATGVIDIMPDIPGFAECWGKSILHCPYCHGYEVKGAPTAILGDDTVGYEFAHFINNWTDKLWLLTNGLSNLTTDQTASLKDKGIEVIESPITEVVHQEGYITHLVFANGNQQAFTAMYAQLHKLQHCDLPEQLGCEMTEHGLVVVDGVQQTTVPGIYAAGDNTTLMRSVSTAVAQGGMAGAMINKEYIMERV